MKYRSARGLPLRDGAENDFFGETKDTGDGQQLGEAQPARRVHPHVGKLPIEPRARRENNRKRKQSGSKDRLVSAVSQDSRTAFQFSASRKRPSISSSEAR